MKNENRLEYLKQLLANELKSDYPGLLYIEDLKLSIARLEESLNRDRLPQYEMINPLS